MTSLGPLVHELLVRLLVGLPLVAVAVFALLYLSDRRRYR